MERNSKKWNRNATGAQIGARMESERYWSADWSTNRIGALLEHILEHEWNRSATGAQIGAKWSANFLIFFDKKIG